MRWVDRQSRRSKHDDGTVWYYWGPWDILQRIDNVLCADGKYRPVYVDGRQQDTYFTQPGYVRVGQHKVSGFVAYDDRTEHNTFMAYEWRKNAHYLPNATPFVRTYNEKG